MDSCGRTWHRQDFQETSGKSIWTCLGDLCCLDVWWTVQTNSFLQNCSFQLWKQRAILMNPAERLHSSMPLRWKSSSCEIRCATERLMESWNLSATNTMNKNNYWQLLTTIQPSVSTLLPSKFGPILLWHTTFLELINLAFAGNFISTFKNCCT